MHQQNGRRENYTIWNKGKYCAAILTFAFLPEVAIEHGVTHDDITVLKEGLYRKRANKARGAKVANGKC